MDKNGSAVMKPIAAACALLAVLSFVLYNAGLEYTEVKVKVSSRAPASIKEESVDAVRFLKNQENEITSIQSELNSIKKCWEADNCRFDSMDPKSSHFAAVERATAALRKLTAIKKQNSAANFTLIAREWIHFPDDHVRSAALDLIGEVKNDRQTLQAVLEGLSESISAPLIEKAMPILENYARSGFTGEVQNFITQTLSGGPIDVSEVIAAQAGRFIDRESLPRFRELSERLPPHSRSRRNLEASILEFKRRQAGG
jgi:hypothetical protein